MAVPKGLKVSINNTPQGNNDSEGFGEWVAGTIQYVDVLANDLGGSSTTLVGLYNHSALPANLGDLLNAGELVQGFEANGVGQTGATVSIVGNKLEYDFSDFAANYYDHLAAGQTLSDTFYYVLRMGNGAYAVAKVDVSITGENDTPTIDSDGGGDTASVLVPEDTSTVTTVHATDPDDGASLTYTIVGGADSDAFTIDPSTGELTFDTPPNFEAPTDTGSDNTYEVQVQVSDGLGGTDTQTITVNVDDVNENPVAPADFAANAAENVNDTTVLATVTGSDPDVGGGNDGTSNFEDLSYSIQSDASGKFEINASTGAISLITGQSLDYETATSHVVTVRVSDGPGLFDDVNVTINVDDVNENPVAPADFAANAAENVNDTTVLATVTGSDPDVGGGNDGTSNFEDLSYSIQSDASGKFEINASTGAISLITGQSLDYETATSHVVTVRVSDGPGLFDDVNVTINVTDVPEISPLFTNNMDSVTFDSIVNGTYVAGTQYNALAGDDIVTLPTNSTEAGEAGYVATNTFLGGAGNDSITGGGLNDTIDGGADNDTIFGGSGDDSLVGGANDDSLSGGAGTDTLRGGDGNDILAYDVNDTFDGGAGFDTLRLLDAADIIANAGFVNRVTSIEVIDMKQGGVTPPENELGGVGGGASVNQLSYQDVLDIGDTGGASSLYVLGDSNDIVRMEFSDTWVAGPTNVQDTDSSHTTTYLNNFNVYTKTVSGVTATVYIETDITTVQFI